MGLFKKKKQSNYADDVDSAALAQRALDFITEGVMLIDESGMIQFANPAAAAMTGYGDPSNITGLDYKLIIRLETSEAVPVEPTTSELYTALMTNKNMTTRDYLLVSAQTEKKLAVSLSCIPTGSIHDFRIVTFRDITVELAEEHEQAEFISTASHEMRTPVASIEGYLGLALNPQTATIDSRAKQYLEAAHAASKHLGNLFKDLLDVTKLDDKRLRPNLVPVDAIELVQRYVSEQASDMAAKKLRYSFGTSANSGLDKKRIDPKVYMAVDLDFFHEIITNLVGNAIKYTPEGGEIWVNARGDGDKVLINVTDTGIGISAEDAGHIFQKFYRVDNSQTRQIGGTGLGLYLVKQRVEAMGGRVWLESAFGDGSTFFVSLPRLSESEYEKLKIAYTNAQMVKNFSAPSMNGNNMAEAKVAAGGTGAAGTIPQTPGEIISGVSPTGVIAMGGTPEPEEKPVESHVISMDAPAPAPAPSAAPAMPSAGPVPPAPTTAAAPAPSSPGTPVISTHAAPPASAPTTAQPSAPQPPTSSVNNTNPPRKEPTP